MIIVDETGHHGKRLFGRLLLWEGLVGDSLEDATWCHEGDALVDFAHAVSGSLEELLHAVAFRKVVGGEVSHKVDKLLGQRRFLVATNFGNFAENSGLAIPGGVGEEVCTFNGTEQGQFEGLQGVLDVVVVQGTTHNGDDARGHHHGANDKRDSNHGHISCEVKHAVRILVTTLVLSCRVVIFIRIVESVRRGVISEHFRSTVEVITTAAVVVVRFVCEAEEIHGSLGDCFEEGSASRHTVGLANNSVEFWRSFQGMFLFFDEFWDLFDRGSQDHRCRS